MKISVGSIVLSKAGRDKGRYFVVTEVVDETTSEFPTATFAKRSKPNSKSKTLEVQR